MGKMKINLKKVCPCCKSNEYDRVKRKWWMRWIPRIKYYQCRRCYAHFISFFDISSLCDRRKDCRYAVDSENQIKIRLSAGEEEYKNGIVIDIGKKGLCFLSSDTLPNTGKPLPSRIYLPYDDTTVDIQLKIVSFAPVIRPDQPEDISYRFCGRYKSILPADKKHIFEFISKLTEAQPTDKTDHNTAGNDTVIHCHAAQG